MSNSEYVSDHESDFDDDIDDILADIVGSEDTPSADDDVLIAPADPNEGEDDSSEADNYESEPEKDLDDEPSDEELPTDEDPPIDLKKVSKYNKEIVVIKPENRRTSSVMSKYEMTEAVSIRATQISQYNNCMVDIAGLDDPIKMAKRELMMRMTPLVLRRVVGERLNTETGEMDTYMELWSPNEMAFAVAYTDVL